MAFKQRDEAAKSPPAPGKPASAPAEKPEKVAAAPKSLPERLMSLDAFRGFTMLLMVSDGWYITRLVEKNPELPTRYAGHWYGGSWKLFWNTAAWQLEHVQWTGCVAWDLIQPCFMFMVGVAMPFSFAKREARGDSWGLQFRHALIRSLILIGLGIFLRSTNSSLTYFTFEDVLTQIGLGYIFVFVLLRAPFVAQCMAVFVILGGYWFAFYHYPLPAEGNQVTRYLTEHGQKPEEWNQFTHAGLKPDHIAEHWNKHTNAAAAADRVFLNLFPRSREPWEGKKFWVNGGGYQTLNFIPSIVTMLFGVMAGQLLRGSWTPPRKLVMLLLAGLGCFVVSMAIDTTIWPLQPPPRLSYSLCPIVKRIWSPSWAVFSAGWAFWFLGLFYWVIDMRGHRRVAFPLAIVGMNSILVYCVAHLSDNWLSSMLRIHLRAFDQGLQGLIVKLGNRLPAVGNLSFVRWLGEASTTDFFYSNHSIFQPIWHKCAILFLIWLICLWLYRRRIFVRI